MTFALFSSKVNYHKNGTFWFQKIFARVIGEQNYEKIRMERRIFSASIWYRRQQFLYFLNLYYPDYAYSLGTYPKIDSSHGIPHPQPWECFRDWQENTINSDGWFGMAVCYICLAFAASCVYSYIIPHYWANQQLRNESDLRHRIKDYYSSCSAEEAFGNNLLETAMNPHDFHGKRAQCLVGFSDPDDARTVFMTTFARKHKIKEYYLINVGEMSNNMRQIA